jgi:hypothetical protein
MANVTITVKDDNLRRLIAAMSGKVANRLIADGVDYGIMQEFTKRGHPSLRPAFEQVVKPIPDAIGKAIEAMVSLDDIFNKAAFDVQTLWAADVNIDTGAYKNSIHVEVE